MSTSHDRYAVRIACAGLSVVLALNALDVSSQSAAATSEWSYFGANRAFTRYIVMAIGGSGHAAEWVALAVR